MTQRLRLDLETNRLLFFMIILKRQLMLICDTALAARFEDQQVAVLHDNIKKAVNVYM